MDLKCGGRGTRLLPDSGSPLSLPSRKASMRRCSRPRGCASQGGPWQLGRQDPHQLLGWGEADSKTWILEGGGGGGCLLISTSKHQGGGGEGQNQGRQSKGTKRLTETMDWIPEREGAFLNKGACRSAEGLVWAASIYFAQACQRHSCFISFIFLSTII